MAIKKIKTEEDYRQIAWNYFKLHANQRIVLFRFYVVFFSLFALVIGHLISEFHFASIYQEWIAIVLSLMFFLITIIFWCLDSRNRYLIHNAEDYFVKYELIFMDKKPNRFVDEINTAKIFTKEKNDTRDGKCPIRHRFCFKIIFSIGLMLSVIFIGFSVLSIYNRENNKGFKCC